MIPKFKPKRTKDSIRGISLSTNQFSLDGGLDRSRPKTEIENQFMSNCKNVYIKDNKVEDRYGYVAFGGNIPLGGDEPITGFANFFAYDGTEYLVCFSTVGAYLYNTTTGNWDDITNVGAAYTSTVSDPWSTDMIYDDDNAKMLYVATNRTDAPQMWDGTNEFEDLGGSPNKCVFLKNFHHHLMMFDVVSGGDRFPQRIDWTAKGTPQGGVDSYNNLAATSDFLIGAEIIRGQLAIFKENSITMCTYVGGTNPFSFDENIIKDVGCIARDSIQSLGSVLIFLAKDNVYIFDGFSVKPVGTRIAKSLIDSIDPDLRKLIHSTIIDELNLYLLFVPKPGSTYCDACWVWNYQEDKWTYFEFNDNICSTGLYQASSASTIGELLDRIGTFSWRIGSRSMTTSFPFVLFGDSVGNIYQFDQNQLNDNGTAIDIEIESKDFYISNQEYLGRLSGINLYAKGDTVDIYISKDGGANYTYQQNIILNNDEFGSVLGTDSKTTAEKIIIKLKNNVLNERVSIQNMIVHSVLKGKKKVPDYLEKVYMESGEMVSVEYPTRGEEFVYVRT